MMLPPEGAVVDIATTRAGNDSACVCKHTAGPLATWPSADGALDSDAPASRGGAVDASGVGCCHAYRSAGYCSCAQPTTAATAAATQRTTGRSAPERTAVLYHDVARLRGYKMVTSAGRLDGARWPGNVTSRQTRSPGSSGIRKGDS